MWFKNLRVYTFAKPLAQSFEEIETALADKLFEPCGSMEKARLGWVSPLGREGENVKPCAGPLFDALLTKTRAPSARGRGKRGD